MTEVWRARAPGGVDCVAKFPRSRWAAHAGAARLVEREREFLERAAGPGVVAAFGLETIGSAPGLLLEYLPGGDLVALAGSHPRHWAGAVRDVASTLLGLHGRGIVHRDVKPRNVLLDDAGRAKLIDFASAASAGATRPAVGGTAAYQSAARRLGADAEPADDVHAFAVTVYELLAGELPFGREPSPSNRRVAPRRAQAERRGLAREPAVAALAEHTLAVLACAPREPARALEVFLTVLQAIIGD